MEQNSEQILNFYLDNFEMVEYINSLSIDDGKLIIEKNGEMIQYVQLQNIELQKLAVQNNGLNLKYINEIDTLVYSIINIFNNEKIATPIQLGNAINFLGTQYFEESRGVLLYSEKMEVSVYTIAYILTNLTYKIKFLDDIVSLILSKKSKTISKNKISKHINNILINFEGTKDIRCANRYINEISKAINTDFGYLKYIVNNRNITQFLTVHI